MNYQRDKNFGQCEAWGWQTSSSSEALRTKEGQYNWDASASKGRGRRESQYGQEKKWLGSKYLNAPGGGKGTR